MSFSIDDAVGFPDLVDRLIAFLTDAGHAHGKTFAGVGTGNLIDYSGTATSVAETWTLTATNATTFTVSGSVSGAQANATVGTPYTAARIAFTITAGGTAYSAGDVWKINTSPKWTLVRGLSGAYQTGLTSIGWTSGANLWDKNPATTATVANASLPASATMELPVAAEILELGITPNATANAPNAFTVAWSDDGVTFTTASTFTGLNTGWTASTRRRFAVTASGAHRWWRVTVTAGNTTPVTIGSLDFFTHAGSVQSLSNEWPFVVMRPPGNDGALSTTTLMVAAVDQTTSDNYSLQFFPVTSYDPMLTVSGQPGYGGVYSIVAASNLTMRYWMVANGRRFMMGLKVSTTYQAGYYGLMLPYARPSAYPLPLFIGGSSIGNRWSDTTDNAHCFPRANQGTLGQAHMRDITGTWRQVATHQNGSSVGSTAGARMMPNAMSNGGLGANLIRENLDGTYPLLPLIPVVDAVGAMGELDGAFFTSGFAQAAEDIITEQRFDHIVLANVFRTGVGDYFALRLD